MKKVGIVAASALALALAACNQGAQNDAAGTGALANLEMAGHRGATIAGAGDSITVTRARPGEQGVTLRRSAAMVHFTVVGENPAMRVAAGGAIGLLPLSEENSIMIGPGGASAISIFSTSGDELVVNVTSVTDCGGAPEGTCVPPILPGPAAAPARVNAPAAPAAAPAPAPTPADAAP